MSINLNQKEGRYLKNLNKNRIPASYIRIQRQICNCPVKDLRLIGTGRVYRIYCHNCKQEVGLMEAHGNYHVGATDIQSFINTITRGCADVSKN